MIIPCLRFGTRRTLAIAGAAAALLVVASCSTSAPPATAGGGSHSAGASSAAGASTSAAAASAPAATSASAAASSAPASTASSGPASKAGAGGGGANLSYVNGQIAKYSKLPTFTAPGPSFDATKLMKGKSIFSVELNTSDQFVQVLEDGMQKVAKQVGVGFHPYTNSGQLSDWVKGIQTGVNEHASVIDLLAGINPALLHPQIAQAKAANIPVVVSDAYDIAQKADPSVAAVTDVPYAQAARLDADWAIADTKGKADVLVIGSSDVVASPFMVKAIDNEFSTYCAACKVKNIDVTVANWATQTGPQVEGALSADPNINYIIPVFDSQSQFIVPAITSSGRTGKVHIATYDGTPFVLKMLEDGNVVTMDVGEDLDWISHAIMDQDMRVAAGLAPSTNEHAPLLIFTKKNVATTGTPPKNSVGYGNSYITGYNKVWGLS